MKKYKKQICLSALIFLVAAFISHNYYQFIMIQGESMLPTYREWQLILLDKTAHDIERGDVILFRCEEAENTLMLKRVIALPNDVVRIEDGVLYVNGQASESVYNNGTIFYSGIAGTALTLAEDEYFVMGDNHEFSVDSRYESIGCVTEAEILGKAMPNLR